MRLEADPLASFADSKLNWPSDNTALGCALRLAFANEETALGTEPITALVAHEAAIVPLTPDGGDDNVIQNGLLAAQATRCSAAGVASQTPSKTIFLDEGSLRIERL